jgi:hypothetical protein
MLLTGFKLTTTFLREWLEALDDWELEVKALQDAGDNVLAIVRQRARSKTSGLPVDVAFGQNHPASWRGWKRMRTPS